MPEKKPSKKKTAARKSASKKSASKAAGKSTAARKKPPASKKSASPKKSTPAGKRATTKKASAKKATAKKATAKKASASSRKGSAKPKASDFVRRPSHTPAIFKASSRRTPHILFTIEDVREVLQKRLREEKEEMARGHPGETTAQKKAVLADQADEPVAKSKHQAASLEDILGLSGGSDASPASKNNVPRKFQKYYKLLIELRNQVREELDLHSSDTLKRSQKEDAGDISISVDAGTDNFDRDFALSLLSSEQDALNEIEAAIDRIHKGTYGVCEVTGNPINAERLEAVPFTRFSVEGQKEHELHARKRVSRTGAFLNDSSGEKISFGDDDGDN